MTPKKNRNRYEKKDCSFKGQSFLDGGEKRAKSCKLTKSRQSFGREFELEIDKSYKRTMVF